MRAVWPFGWALLLGLVLGADGAAAKTPWEELFGPGKPRIWSDPEGRFQLDLPIGWEAEAPGNGAPVRIHKKHPDYGTTALVTVAHRRLPPGTALRHLESHVAKETAARSPGYELLDRSVREGPGRRAVWRYFRYRHRGNVELMREVVQVLTLAGERAFIITLTTPYGARGPFWEDFETMMDGFSGRAPGQESWDQPEERRRIRAGEMIHPDAIGY
jgi:hypothetical protein